MAPNELSMWLPLLLFISLYLIFKKKNQNKQLPPSPSRLPVLGNLHQLRALLHQSYRQLSEKYGPVMFLQLGQIRTVVISSAEAAKEVLKDHDLACCSRPLLYGAGRLSYDYLDVGFAPYGHYWRNMKKLIVQELFSLKRVQSFRFLREEEVELLINSISVSEIPINLTDKLFTLTANITYRIAFGFDYRGTEFDKDRFHEVVHDAAAIAGSFSLGELFFPFAGWIIDRLTGHHAKVERIFHEIDKFFEFVINDHLKPGRKKAQDDMIDVLLAIEKEQDELGTTNFTRNNVKAVLMDLFTAGVETSAITLDWAMAELLRNPRVMKRVQAEVRNQIGKQGRVTEATIEQLQYLKMIIKETLRLHPSAPLLLPREAMSHFKINGYNIYPKTMIQVNAWAIGRDPKYWQDPEEFFPERFADNSIEYKGQNFEFLPFGAGRRICPGINMATATVEVALANLLYCFDWKLPDGMSIEDINMEEKARVSLTISKKTPLILVPVKQDYVISS